MTSFLERLLRMPHNDTLELRVNASPDWAEQHVDCGIRGTATHLPENAISRGIDMRVCKKRSTEGTELPKF
ncbi:hypothetical protein FRC14_001969 [Serendipita sp. 396]|nr:hypothetical protein FRC14_001969 [Serendipita sp. 396]